MKRFGLLFLLAFLLTLGSNAWGQNAYRFDDIAILSQGAYSPVVTTPSVAISVCPATATIVGTSCSPLATTFTDSTGLTACVNPNQVVLQNTNVCVANSDQAGNFGFWVLPGNYIYCITPSPGVVAPGKCQVRTIGNPTGGTSITTGIAGDRQPIIINPNFDTLPLTLPPFGWASNTNTFVSGGNLSAGTTLAYETVNPAPGKAQSLKMTTIIANGQILNNSWWSVIPGETYTVSCSGRSADGVGVPACDIAFRASNGAGLTDLIASGTTSTSWQSLSATGVVPAGADFAIYRTINFTATQPSTIEFDNVRVSNDTFPAITSIAPNTDLTLSESGDASGVMKWHLRNRPGANGLVVDDPVFTLADSALVSSATITNIAIDGSNNLTVTANFNTGGSTFPAVGQDVNLIGLTTATFLNNQNVVINSINSTQFTATFVHAAYTSAPDTGTAFLQANVRAEWRNDKVTSSLNNTGEVQILDPFGAAGQALKWASFGKVTTAVPNNLVAGAFLSNTLMDRQPLIPNPSFENQRGSTQSIPGPTGPFGWIRNHGNETITFETSTQAPNKNESVKVVTIDQNGGLDTLNFYSVLGGDLINLTAFVKADGSSTAGIFLCWYDKTGTNISCSATSSTSTSWTQLAVTGTAPATAIAYNFSCLNSSVTQPSTIWCDEFSAAKTSVQTGGNQAPWYLQRLDAGNLYPELIGGSTGAGVGWVLIPVTTGATQKSWFVTTNQNVGQLFELIPSTTNGGTTPSATDAWSLDVSGNTIQTGGGTYLALGTATSGANFQSQGLFFNNSFWNGSAAVTAQMEQVVQPGSGANPNIFWSWIIPSNAPTPGIFQWSYAKAATNVLNQNGPLLEIIGNSWTGSASQQEFMTLQTIVGSGANPATTLLIAHGGGSGTPNLQANMQIVSNGAIGGGTAAALFASAAGATSLDLRDTTQGADAKNWDFINSGGTLSGRAVNDANNSATTWFNVLRSGATVTTVQFLPNISSTRINPRVITMADATSITPTSDTADENIFSSSQAAGTLTVNAPSGTPVDGQKLVLRLKAANAQTYSFNATYHFSTSVTAPATLAAGKTDYLGLIFNAAASIWDVVAVDQGHTD